MNKNKEELLNKLKQLEDDFNAQASEIKKQIEECDKKVPIEECDKKVWKLNKGDKYYLIAYTGGILDFHFNNDNYDNKIIDFGNCFETKEEAKRKRFEIRLHRQLELFALENNETEINWNDNSEKYMISYNRDGGLFIDEVYSLKDFGQVYFASEEVARKAIETFKDDLIRYFRSNK